MAKNRKNTVSNDRTVSNKNDKRIDNIDRAEKEIDFNVKDNDFEGAENIEYVEESEKKVAEDIDINSDILDDDMFAYLDEIEVEPEIKEFKSESGRPRKANNKKKKNIKDKSVTKSTTKPETKPEQVRDVVANCRQILTNKRKSKEDGSDNSSKLELLLKNKMALYIAGGVVIFIILICVIIGVGSCQSKDDEDKKTTDEAQETTTEEQTTIDESVPVALPSNSEITTLIENYLQAERIDADIEELSKYVDDMSQVSLEKYEILKKYIESFQNITCYQINSVKENTYVVVVTYGIKFYNVETAAPGCESFIIVNKDEKYYVHNLTVKEVIDTYISSDIDKNKIKTLEEGVNASLSSAIASDADLAAVFNALPSDDTATQ